ncbi:transient receptor potential cation channel subfamily V member 5 isoform X2 [Daktulosphaira vitifoliae]|uniref:transient receptor potential cation channel subfamily V member 5 isoform X2 n=2 Tax=Daktulosphaira vitifoliae TaxID=58002 RepID=UPI0021AAA225|nr:transient receptor potential cation channel subfamily V member 5 isoform X2 [Daktulosphaira vitifoliae]
MGNTESNVASGVKKQVDSSPCLIYNLVDLKGGGLLVDLIKRAVQTKEFAELDYAIKTKVEPLLYNKGEGKMIPIAKLVLLRNRDRSRAKLLPHLKNMEDPNDYDIDKDIPTIEELEKFGEVQYREVCWDLKERGAVGETVMHLCLLNATSIHADLAKRLLKFYPKLVNDIYMVDEYYGESVLHIAIVNEDPAMVKVLMDSGANLNERCFGNFMCPEDQKASRSDSLNHEWVNVCPDTNYEGYVYWGEYPLSFAACLGQEESYRLMLARGADPNNQDTNGNTVLHMLVIYEKISTFDMAYEIGADLNIRNYQNLTPLTLAAKLARIQIFFHILNIEREIYWQIGSITCAAYPLTQIDTIDNDTGQISRNSALNLVVFGESPEHLEMIDGALVDLLNAKWNTFVKFRFYRQFFLFAFYFTISMLCFVLRPGPPPSGLKPPVSNYTSTTTMATTPMEFLDNESLPENIAYDEMIEITELEIPETTMAVLITDNPTLFNYLNDTSDISDKQSNMKNLHGKSSNSDKSKHKNWDTNDKNSSMNNNKKVRKFWWSKKRKFCRLLIVNTTEDLIRIGSEVTMLIGAFLYLLAAIREARFLGLQMFFENLAIAPARVMFLFSCTLMMTVPPLRYYCYDKAEDITAVIIMLTTCPYFLFFCRGFKTVGPFVVMIYRMIMGDLLRFVSIYMVFVMGFSQAYYVIFLSFDNPLTPGNVDDIVENPMPSPIESIMAMFLMSVNAFAEYYEAFDKTSHTLVAKFCFIVFMVIVAILLVNMLIAMMGNTYQKIAETRNEWQRQWARIVLVVERGVSPSQRHKNLMQYSQPMSDGRRALVLRLNQSDEDKEEMKEMLEMKRIHYRYVERMKARDLSSKLSSSCCTNNTKKTNGNEISK